MDKVKRLLFLDMDGVIADMPEGMSRRWGEIGFWETFPKTPWADQLVALCTDHALVHILSSLGGGPASGTGKLRWLEHHYPHLVEGTILTKAKYLLAQPGRILVDDDPKNIQLFEMFGGVGVQVPNLSRFPTVAEGKSLTEVFECLLALLS